MNASAPAGAKRCSEASQASACIFVLRGCMCLLSLTATCQVCTVSLKAGLYTYKGFAADCLQPALRLPAAAEGQRCYDCQCQELAADFLRSAYGFLHLGASAEPEPGRDDG